MGNMKKCLEIYNMAHDVIKRQVYCCDCNIPVFYKRFVQLMLGTFRDEKGNPMQYPESYLTHVDNAIHNFEKAIESSRALRCMKLTWTIQKQKAKLAYFRGRYRKALEYSN